jgi:hypothetical protein
MKATLFIFIVAISISFFTGYFYKSPDLYDAASKYPRGGLGIPTQWFMMNSAVGWERMMLVFGYADNVEVCQHLVEVAKTESPDRDFRCTDAN